MADQPDFSNKRVLIVDNTKGSVVILKNMLNRLGAGRIEEAQDYHQAMTKIESQYFDLIYCDVSLGNGLSGQQLLRDLRFSGRLPMRSVFIFVSSEQSRDMVLGSIEGEPDGYIIKPFQIGNVETRTKRFMARNDKLRGMLDCLDEGDRDGAEKALESIARKDPRLKPVAWNYMGRALFHHQFYEKARRYFAAIQGIHRLHWAELGEAQCLAELGHFDTAQARFEAVLESHPYAVPALDGIARCHELRGDKQRCLASLQRGVELSPLSVNRHQKTAALSFELGEFNVAAASAKRVVQLCERTIKDTPKLRATYLQCLRKQLEEDPENAQSSDVLKRAMDKARDDIKQYPDHSELRLNFAMLSAIKNNKERGQIYAKDQLDSIVENFCEHLEASDQNLEDVVMAYRLSSGASESSSVAGRVASIAARKRNERFQCCFKHGSKAYRKGKLRDALEQFMVIQADFPSAISANLNVAHLICRLAETEDDYSYAQAFPYLAAIPHIDRDHQEFKRYQFLCRLVKSNAKAKQTA